MPSPSKAKLTVFYSFDDEDKSLTFNLDPCEVDVEYERIEVAPKDGYRCYEIPEPVTVTIRLKGTKVKHVGPHDAAA